MKSIYEVERRFLVTDRDIVAGHTGNILVQAYLFSVDGYSVRVRRTHVPTSESGLYDEGPAILTAKGPRTGQRREEYEVEVPTHYASELIQRAPARVSKIRFQIIDNDRLWDVDLFQGENDGLVIAECEGRDTVDLVTPTWCGEEITNDRRYDNEQLARCPYSTWSDPG